MTPPPLEVYPEAAIMLTGIDMYRYCNSFLQFSFSSVNPMSKTEQKKRKKLPNDSLYICMHDCISLTLFPSLFLALSLRLVKRLLIETQTDILGYNSIEMDSSSST